MSDDVRTKTTTATITRHVARLESTGAYVAFENLPRLPRPTDPSQPQTYCAYPHAHKSTGRRSMYPFETRKLCYYADSSSKNRFETRLLRCCAYSISSP